VLGLKPMLLPLEPAVRAVIVTLAPLRLAEVVRPVPAGQSLIADLRLPANVEVLVLVP
jgi:hypothetical protein